MIINHNMQAINANRQMGVNQVNAQKNMEKLSSGLRINRAGDDAAGLAISEKMRAQVRGLDQAGRNAQDAISMIQTAEGALNETHSILQRMRELGVQAGNDTNTDTDRSEIQKEINQLTSEINRIGNTTEFNNQKILKGQDIDVKTSAQGVKGVTAADGAATVEGLTFTGVGSGATVNGVEIEVVKSGTTGTTTSASFSGNKLQITIGEAAGEDANAKIQAAVQGLGDKTGSNGTIKFGTMTVAGTSTATTTASKATVSGGVTAVTAKVGSYEVSGELAAGKMKIDGIELSITGSTQDELFASLAAQVAGNTTLNAKYDVTAYTNGAEKLTLTQKAGQEDGKTLSAEVDTKEFSMQVGANQNQTMTVEFGNMRANALGIVGTGDGFTSETTVTNGTDNVKGEKALDVSNAGNAGIAVTKIQEAINTVSAERSKMGAMQNRLEHTINNLGTSSENLTAAESRIRDVDMAKEMMQMSKNNILQQASQAMLAQANQAPQQVLQLLR